MASGRRWLGILPKLTRRSWEDVSRELEEYLRRLWASEADGIPPGFKDVLPESVSAGTAGTAGDETQGWAAATHQHVATTAAPVPVGLLLPDAAGSSGALARSDHRHEVQLWRTVGVTVEGGPTVTAGPRGFVGVPFSGTITGWELLGDQVGDCVIDVWLSHRTPNASNSICGAAKPTLSGAASASGGVAGWTGVTVRKGDIVGFYVDSASTLTLVTLTVTVRETP